MGTKDQMLDKALNLFVEKGYDNVGVQSIVDAVGVQKPTLYHYFKSKPGLLAALLERDCLPFLDQVSQAASYNRDLPWTLEKVANCYFRFAQANTLEYRFILGAAFGPPDSTLTRAFIPYFDRQHRILSTIFESASRDHGNMRHRHHIHAITFLGSLNSMIVSHWHNPGVRLGEKEAFTTCKHFMYGIFS